MLTETKARYPLAVSDFLTSLCRGLKTSVLYPPTSTIPSEFKRICWDKLQSALSDSTRVDLEVTRQNILTGGDIVYKSTPGEVSLSETLHRDGVRTIRIYPSISRDEFECLFDRLLAVYSRRESKDDIVNLFWEAGFESIEYEAVDSFVPAELSPAAGEVTLDDNAIGNIVKSEGEQPEAKSESESPATRDGVKFPEVFGSVQTVSEDEKAAVSESLEHDQEGSIELVSVDLLFDIAAAEQDYHEFLKVLDNIDNVFNRLLKAEFFPLLIYLMRKFRDSAADWKESSRQRSERVRESYHRCGDRIRISQITQILNRSEHENIEQVRSYLEELDSSALAQLVWMLGELKHYPARKLVCDLVVAMGRKRPEIVASGIYDSRWYVARNAAMILGEIGSEKSIPDLRKASEHEDERVRWEATISLSGFDTDAALEHLARLVNDPSERIRRQATKRLTERRFKPAFDAILSFIESESFGLVTPAEQRELFRALGATGADRALDYLKKKATKRSLFGGGASRHQRELAVGAMAELEDEESYRLLKEWTTKKGELGEWARNSLAKRDRVRMKTDESR
jgi:HEAT repeat protein